MDESSPSIGISDEIIFENDPGKTQIKKNNSNVSSTSITKPTIN
ncbi:hypothetical protein DDB_G0268952 [Dictyostelium discoideum AX4]|uniref:Uncharacterized protein n=1 Tax=Dictyostelium discoideum TaxID=44689 RepID=Q55EW9_DICDI|nr:hypothetical protein DDB_G0268952 [Dictyostelium discoideum AX4]EAL73065.1 hypothetical protein DDB_G0268952 [Dictyostelium discoideum AX4]|eukprot:XP_646901.1 hypothetical protein DDB_G0268952 [Dictyostelium discoideum AX4]